MSLEVLKPPTDTLYKFLAILGLLFFLSSLLSPIWIHREFDAQESEYARDLQLLILNKQGWQDAQKEVERASAESDRAQKDLLEVGDRYDKKQASLQEMKRALDKRRKRLSVRTLSLRISGPSYWSLTSRSPKLTIKAVCMKVRSQAPEIFFSFVLSVGLLV